MKIRESFEIRVNILKILRNKQTKNIGTTYPKAGVLNYLSHCSSGPQYELICIQPIRDRAYSLAYSQPTAGDSTLGIN